MSYHRDDLCPVCDGAATRAEWTNRQRDCIEVVRTCPCGAEFVCRYEVIEVEVTHDPTSESVDEQNN